MRLLTQIYKIERNSQPHTTTLRVWYCWDFSRKFTKLKGIHNGVKGSVEIDYVETSHANLQNWKEFTTDPTKFEMNEMLRLLTQIYKIERNSQQQ